MTWSSFVSSYFNKILQYLDDSSHQNLFQPLEADDDKADCLNFVIIRLSLLRDALQGQTDLIYSLRHLGIINELQ